MKYLYKKRLKSPVEILFLATCMYKILKKQKTTIKKALKGSNIFIKFIE